MRKEPLMAGIGKTHGPFGQPEQYRRSREVSIPPIRECIPPRSGEQVTEARGACPGLIFHCSRRPFLDVLAPHTYESSIGDGAQWGDR